MAPCLGPITVRVPSQSSGRIHRELVRCGQCRACRVRRKRAWLGRLALELEEHRGIGRFLTLTYADPPERLEYRDFQLFMKRYRKTYGRCRFFVTGEYGEKSGRPHWHAILFGQSASTIGHLELPAWSHGYSFDGEANMQSLGYVAGYVLKKAGGLDEHLVRMSNRPGIGLRSIASLASSAAKVLADSESERWPSSYRFNGRNYPLAGGALACYQREFLKEGGRPPRADDPSEREARADEYRSGDDFFQDRRRRAIWAALERDNLDGPKARRIATL